MANFPDSIYNPRVMVNRPGVVYDPLKTKVIYAEDFNKDRDELVAIETFLQKLPEGSLWNGKIVPSVASSNLTLALKTLAGDDPSAGDPVFVMINGTLHAITSALSVTKNSGTNWFNAGSSELAAKEIDFFAYLGYNADDGVVIGFSRIPFACQYSDFSATTTNEKYCAISDISNAASNDPYVVIGRFASTLGVAGTYYFSVPTYTPSNLVQRPIYETRWLFYEPTLAWTAGAAPSGSPTVANRYKLSFSSLFVNVIQYGFTAGTTVTRLILSFPFVILNYSAGSGMINITNTPNLTYVKPVGSSNAADLYCTSGSHNRFNFSACMEI